MSDIREIITEFNLTCKIEAVDGIERLVYDDGASDKWEILRILDDDYLDSRLTKLKYEANSKRSI